VIRPEHMYRNPLTFMPIVQVMVVFWPHHQLQFWDIAKALEAFTVFCIALYILPTMAQAAKVKISGTVNCIEMLSMLFSMIWWLTPVFEFEYLTIESILIAVNLCKKLLKVTTIATITALKHAHNKCRTAAYKTIRAGIKHVLYKQFKTEYAYKRDMMTTCKRCDSSIAIAVNTPCGHTFLCWSCAEQYRDEHGDICNTCHEDNTLLKL
jgi:hypothetical protein